MKEFKNEKEKILDVLEEVTDILPTWLNGGSSILEGIDAEEERKEKIEEYCKTRKNMRRTHYKIVDNGLVKCSNCGEMIRPHRACPKCGFYKGEQVSK